MVVKVDKSFIYKTTKILLLDCLTSATTCACFRLLYASKGFWYDGIDLLVVVQHMHGTSVPWEGHTTEHQYFP